MSIAAFGRRNVLVKSSTPAPNINMKKEIIHSVAVPHEQMNRGYAVAVCEDSKDSSASASPDRKTCRTGLLSKSDDEEHGSVVGCYADDSNASARTLNCNYPAGYDVSNFAGAFAVNNKIGKHLVSQVANLKITDSSVATGGQGRCDYDLPPFINMDKEDGKTAESNATATIKDAVLHDLAIANKKRKLKNLKRFFVSKELIEMAFDRTISRTNAADKEIKEFIENRRKVCERVLNEMQTVTYCPELSERRIIKKRGKGDKDRNADVFCLYDRIIHTLILIVIEQKFRNMMIRNIYSGIKGRSLISKNRTYCMVNQIRHWVKTHQDKYVGLTDIRHFYENLRMDIVLGEMFRVIVCPFTRWLLVTAFRNTDRLPIGGSLSQIMAMYTIVDADRDVLKRFPVVLFAFGDNRLIGGDKTSVRDAMSFYMSYYEGRYGLSVKSDYQLRKVSDGFRFCKFDYNGSYVHVRSEIRRRAIRAKKKGMQHYAGYKGFLMVTDSNRLRKYIENDYMELINKHGMTITKQRGDKVKFRDLQENAEIFPIEYSIEKSTVKENGMMIRIVYILIKPNGEKRLCHSTEGSEEIVEFFKLVEEGKEEYHRKLHVCHDGTKNYFSEFHTTKQEACDILCKMYNI